SLIKMILAILSPQRGEVYIYSNTAKEQSVKASPRSRCNCVYVPQGNSIISGTIRYNLLLGNMNASETQMKEALYSASAEFVFN
ncbi:ABC transporter ATP-binding protein, partial [Fusicatenibacter saccharivorans]|nr:ABC transporter ATP-binding protein [Fusicatenibacter saccharivorans]